MTLSLEFNAEEQDWEPCRQTFSSEKERQAFVDGAIFGANLYGAGGLEFRDPETKKELA